MGGESETITSCTRNTEAFHCTAGSWSLRKVPVFFTPLIYCNLFLPICWSQLLTFSRLNCIRNHDCILDPDLGNIKYLKRCTGTCIFFVYPYFVADPELYCSVSRSCSDFLCYGSYCLSEGLFKIWKKCELCKNILVPIELNSQAFHFLC